MTLDELAKEFDNIASKFSRDLEREVGRNAKIIQAEAKSLAPVDTGNLRNNITSDTERNGYTIYGIISCDVEYGPYVEYGTGIYSSLGTGRQTPWLYKAKDGKFYYTRGQQPQPFMNPALDNNFDTVKKNLEKFVENYLDD